MRLLIDRVFLTQAGAFGLALGCERCAHYDDRPTGDTAVTRGRCAHGYPNALHVSEAFEAEGREASFCKEWELA